MAKRLSNSEWFNRIESADKIYKPFRKNYKTWVEFFRGNQWSLDEIGDILEPIVVNYTYNTIRTMIPTLYFKNPKIYVHPTRPEFEQGAAIVQDLINYDWRTLYIKNEFKRAILRTLIGGYSWIETGYTFEMSEIQSDGADLTEEQIERIASGQPAEEEQVKQQLTEFRIKKDRPFAISRSILDVTIDPFCSVFEEKSYHAIKEIKPLEMVKRDPRFEGTRNLEANAEFDDGLALNNMRDEYRKSTDLKFVELWHVFDKWEGRAFTIARGHKSKLRKFDIPEGFDVVPLYFNDDPEQPQPISVVEQMMDQQREKNRMRSLMLEHIKRSLPRMAYDKTVFTNQADLEKLANSSMDELIGMPGNPSQLLQPINFPSLPADMFSVDSRLNEDMQIASGLTDFQRGQALKVPSASEAQFIEQSSRLRVDEGLDVVGEVAAQVSENIIKLRQKFTTGDQVIPITGEDGARSWRNYTRQEIQGEFEFVPEYGSTQKRDQDFFKTQFSAVIPIVQNLIASNDPRMFELGRQALKVWQIPQPLIDKIFPPQGNPQDMLSALLGGGQGQPQGGGGQQQAPANPLEALLAGGL